MEIHGWQRRKRLMKITLSIIEYNNNPNESLSIIKKRYIFCYKISQPHSWNQSFKFEFNNYM